MQSRGASSRKPIRVESPPCAAVFRRPDVESEMEDKMDRLRVWAPLSFLTRVAHNELCPGDGGEGLAESRAPAFSPS